jgi:type IV pilus assembly protein PilC
VSFYRFRAVAADGVLRRGHLQARSEHELEARLARQGLELLVSQELSPGRARRCGRRVGRPRLIHFCAQLQQLLAAGVPLLDALDDLHASDDSEVLRQVCASLGDDIRGGLSLSAALAQHPGVFSPVFVALIAAGEQSGRLESALARLETDLKWEEQHFSRLRQALYYPALVGVLLLCVLAFLLVYVVPELVSFLRAMGEALPWQTRWLLAGARIAQQYGVLLAVRMDALALRIPLAGPLVHKLTMTRLCHALAMLYGAGVTVIDSVAQLHDLAGNRALAAALSEAGDAMRRGSGVSAGFAASGLFPSLVVRMLQVGETSGALDSAMLSVASFYARDVERTMARLQATLLPAVTVILGAILLWIAFAVFGPLYGLFTRVGI